MGQERQFSISPKIAATGQGGLVELAAAVGNNYKDYAITHPVALGILSNVRELAPALDWAKIDVLLSEKFSFSHLAGNAPEAGPREKYVRSRASNSIISIMRTTEWALSSPEIVVASAGFIRSAISDARQVAMSKNLPAAEEYGRWITELDTIVADYAVAHVFTKSTAKKSPREKAMYAEKLYTAVKDSTTLNYGEARKNYFSLLKEGKTAEAEQLLVSERRIAGQEPSEFDKIVIVKLLEK